MHPRDFEGETQPQTGCAFVRINGNVVGEVELGAVPAGDNHLGMDCRMDDGTAFSGLVLRHQFGVEKTFRDYQGLGWQELGDLFDFGYCLTVHKSQGSESEKVVLFEQRLPMMDDDEWRRWLYTGVTRAKQSLVVVG